MLLNSKVIPLDYEGLSSLQHEPITGRLVLTFLTEFFKKHGISTIPSSDSVVLDLLVLSDDLILVPTTTASFKELLQQELMEWLTNLDYLGPRMLLLSNHQVRSVKSWTRLRAYTNPLASTSSITLTSESMIPLYLCAGQQAIRSSIIRLTMKQSSSPSQSNGIVFPLSWLGV
ncbi:hypothetical protein D3C71_866960 [compost metagenome]